MKLKTILSSVLGIMIGSSAWASEEQAVDHVPSFMANVYGRDYELLNGRWNVIVDLYDQGERMQIYRNLTPEKNEEFYEYSFSGGLRLDVPGDWNSQEPELMYYEGTVWYARHFDADVQKGVRQFIYFGAVSYRCKVYLNGELVTEHEGGFTPFQVEVTGRLEDGDNFLCVMVNNRRTPDAIPALAFDWWNYGGITRDVMLVRTPEVFVNDYHVRLDGKRHDRIRVSVSLSETVSRDVSVKIPELGLYSSSRTGSDGNAEIVLRPEHLQLWNPENAKLYEVEISSGEDTVCERIGFRYIETDGTQILINGVPTFMRSISFHEEIPQRMGRAFSEADAAMLLNEAKALGVNMIRLAHYPQNEYIVRMAEEMGIVLWEEIPVWQGIDFSDIETAAKARYMMAEMMRRDRNRCAVCFWGIANETKPSEARNSFLLSVLEEGRKYDSGRLYAAAFDLVYFNRESGHFEMDDPFADNLDVVAVNKYMGWYHPWPVDPSEAVWDVVPDKPLIISEFGGEALYGQHGSQDVTSSWSEEYQARLYRDNLEMFRHIPNLAGVSPWILFDFRSPYRFHPQNQEGWNRKGLVSDRGYRKQAWYIMHNWYMQKKKDTQTDSKQ